MPCRSVTGCSTVVSESVWATSRDNASSSHHRQTRSDNTSWCRSGWGQITHLDSKIRKPHRSLASSLNRATGMNLRQDDWNNPGDIVPFLPKHSGKFCLLLLGMQHQEQLKDAIDRVLRSIPMFLSAGGLRFMMAPPPRWVSI